MPTDMGCAAGEDAMNRAKQDNLLHRLNDPREVARFITFLLSTQNISGQIFNLDSRPM